MIKIPEIKLSRWNDGYGVFSNRGFSQNDVVEICPVKVFTHTSTALPVEIQTIMFGWDALTKRTPPDANHKEPIRQSGLRAIVAGVLRKLPLFNQVRGKFRRRKPQKLLLALGYGSMYNHNDSPNVGYKLSDDQQSLVFFALSKIEKDDQLTISYYHPSGEVKPDGSARKDWFARHGITKIEI